MRNLINLFSSCSHRIRYKTFSSARPRFLFPAKRDNFKFSSVSNLKRFGAVTSLGFISVCIHNDPRELHKKLFRYSRLDRGEDIKRLVSSSAIDVNDRHELGWTCLHVAVAKRNLSTVEILLKAGADPNKSYEFRRTEDESLDQKPPHEIMCEENHLCQSLDTRTNFKGFTSLHFAVFMGNAEMVKCLLEAGADPSKKDEQGFTPSNYTNDQNILELLKRKEDRETRQEVEDKFSEDRKQKDEPEEASDIVVEQGKQIFCSELKKDIQGELEEMNKTSEFREEKPFVRQRQEIEERFDAKESGNLEQNQKIADGVRIRDVQQIAESSKSEKIGNLEEDKETMPVINESSDEGKIKTLQEPKPEVTEVEYNQGHESEEIQKTSDSKTEYLEIKQDKKIVSEHDCEVKTDLVEEQKLTTEPTQEQKPHVTEVEGNQRQGAEEMQKTNDSEVEDLIIKQENKKFVSELDCEVKAELVEEQKLKPIESELVEITVYSETIKELDYAEPMDTILAEECHKVFASEESTNLRQCDEISDDKVVVLEGWEKREFEEEYISEQIDGKKAWYEKSSVRYTGYILIVASLCLLGIKPF